jgi:hypothetical protein
MQKTGSIKRKDTSIRNSFPFLFLALTFFPISILSQDRDAGLWSGFELEKGINKWLEVRGIFEVRLDNNISQAERYLAEFGLRGNMGKYFDASLYYRYTYRFFPEYNWASYNRFYADVRFKYDYMAFSFYERVRLTLDEIPPFLDDGYLETVTRFKTQASYNIRQTPLSARGSVELFNPVSRTFDPVPEKTRYKLGIEYIINRSVSAELDYLFQKTSYRNKPQNHYIWVVKLCYKL